MAGRINPASVQSISREVWQKILNGEPSNLLPVNQIPVNTINFLRDDQGHPLNPRGNTANIRVDNLVESITQSGIKQPIELAWLNNQLFVIDGQRRLMSVQQLGWPTIPAFVIEYDNIDQVIADTLSWVNNEPIKPTAAFGRACLLMNQSATDRLTYQEISKLTGISAEDVGLAVELVKAPEDVQNAVDAGMSIAAFKAIRNLTNAEMLDVLNKYKPFPTVAQARKYVQALSGADVTVQRTSPTPPATGLTPMFDPTHFDLKHADMIIMANRGSLNEGHVDSWAKLLSRASQETLATAWTARMFNVAATSIAENARKLHEQEAQLVAATSKPTPEPEPELPQPSAFVADIPGLLKQLENGLGSYLNGLALADKKRTLARLIMLLKASGVPQAIILEITGMVSKSLSGQ